MKDGKREKNTYNITHTKRILGKLLFNCDKSKSKQNPNVQRKKLNKAFVFIVTSHIKPKFVA